ncbi:MAG TPA: glycosyltransferase [Acidobacteriota bacterium]|jgi:glycosyltransferase involved in cell wall biosynthesis
MRVAQIGVAHPYRGGIAHYTTSLHRELLQRGHSSLVVSFSRLYPAALFPGRSQFDQSGEVFSIENQRLLDSLNPLSWRRAARRIAEFEPDAVVFQYWHPFFAPAYASLAKNLRSRNIPVVALCHNVRPHEPHLFSGFLRDRFLRSVSRFLVHSEQDQKTLEDLCPGAVVVRARHPVYLLFGQSRLDPQAARAQLQLPAAGKIALFFGHVRKYKGLDTLLQSLPLVLRQVALRLLIAGEFYEPVEKFQSLIRSLELEPHVTIHNRYIPNEKVSLYFSAADLLVAPYHAATQSGVVPAAYGFNLPVITTSVGGLHEAVMQDRTGFLVKPDDPAALARAIVDYFRSGCEPEFRRNIEEFKRQFSWDGIINGIERLAAAGIGTGKAEGGRRKAESGKRNRE